MAATSDYNQPFIESQGYSLFHTVIPATTTIWNGALAVNNAGSAALFTSALYTGGAPMLGCAQARFENPGALALTRDPMHFKRGLMVELNGKAGDLPTLSEIGKVVYVDDSNTCRKTGVATDFACTLLRIIGNKYLVYIP